MGLLDRNRVAGTDLEEVRLEEYVRKGDRLDVCVEHADEEAVRWLVRDAVEVPEEVGEPRLETEEEVVEEGVLLRRIEAEPVIDGRTLCVPCATDLLGDADFRKEALGPRPPPPEPLDDLLWTSESVGRIESAAVLVGFEV